MAEEAGLPELIDALRWRWKLALLVAVPLFLGTAAYAESLPNEYQGESVVTVAPRATLASGPDPALVTVGAPKYVSYATAQSTVRELAAELGEDPESLQHSVDASLATDTGDITITAADASPERAAEIANVFAEALVSFSRTDDLLTASIVAPAAVPSAPSGPPRRLMEASALIVGALLGGVVAFLVERSRPRVRTWRDIAVLAGYPVVGRLPVSRALRSGPEAAFADAVLGAAVRTLRTNLEREMGAVPHGVLALTSSVPDEGKSATAAVFATALARLGSRVLLIDADLHRTALSRGLPVDPTGGLAGLLRGVGTLQEKVRPGWTPGLSVLTTAADPNAGELVARNFERVVDEARRAFDVVIVDSPPLLGIDDTSAIVTMVDGVLLVVSIGTMAAPVSESVLALRALRANVWGTVANRLPRSGAGAAGNYAYAPLGS